MYCDYHLHTYYSDDSEYPMEILVQDAVKKGLSEICFTDHVDYGIKEDWPDSSNYFDPKNKKELPAMNVKYPAYHAEINRLKKKYEGKIGIKEGIYPFSNVSDIIEEIFKRVIYDGKGIEVNTSSIRYGLSGWMPSWNILSLYKQMGGEIITIGSDTHEATHLGAYIPEAMKDLKEYGFRYICTYEKMKPIFHKL